MVNETAERSPTYLNHNTPGMAGEKLDFGPTGAEG
jgi:hypothetical protein